MQKNFFYHSVLSDSGYNSLIDGNKFRVDKSILLCGPISEAKQLIFDAVKSELDKRKIIFTDFRAAHGGVGIHCPSLGFKIVDAEHCKLSRNDNFAVALSKFSDGRLAMNEYAEIRSAVEEKEKQMLRAKRFLSVSGTIKNELAMSEARYINHQKLNVYAYNIHKRLSKKMSGKIGVEHTVYVTCPTADGIEVNYGAFDLYCDKLLTVRDRTGAVSQLLIDRIRRYALGSGHDVISCRCALEPKVTEHMIIPSLKFGIFTSKYFHRDDFPQSKKTYAKRFMYPQVENISQRTEFCLRAYKEMLREVFSSLKKADGYDRRINEIYLPHIDIRAVNEYIFNLIF